jgi:hypothetical protein
MRSQVLIPIDRNLQTYATPAQNTCFGGVLVGFAEGIPAISSTFKMDISE